MADFLENFKRRESQSSEGSLGEEDDDYEPQFAQEQINHHSDEEQGEQKTNSRPVNTKSHNNEEKKQIRVNEQRKNGNSPNKNQQKKDYYLYAGEEKPYESDPEDQNQGQKSKTDPKNEKKLDPTFVPKGTFYQHDTRGEEVEFAPKKGSDKLNKYKWKHDKFEKPQRRTDKDNAEGGNKYYEKKSHVVYVAKGEKAPEGEEGYQKQPQPQSQPKSQSQAQPQRPRNQEQKPYYKKNNYNKEKDAGYSNKQQVEYVKKDSTKKSQPENAGQSRTRDNRDYYVEYVPKKQETK